MYWKWQLSGLALAFTFFLTAAVVQPIGVSTQFVVADALLASSFDSTLIEADPAAKSGYKSSNAYLNKSAGKLAAAVANPVDYSMVFVLSMVLGGFLARISAKGRLKIDQLPKFHEAQYGTNPYGRYIATFVGGIIVLFGARLAGGCTSGHMMSGMMQTSVSGYLFALGTFLVAVPTAVFLYRK